MHSRNVHDSDLLCILRRYAYWLSIGCPHIFEMWYLQLHVKTLDTRVDAHTNRVRQWPHPAIPVSNTLFNGVKNAPYHFVHLPYSEPKFQAGANTPFLSTQSEYRALACCAWSPADWATFVEGENAWRLQVVSAWTGCGQTGAPSLWEFNVRIHMRGLH